MEFAWGPFRNGDQDGPFQPWLKDDNLLDEYLLTSFWITVIGVRDKAPPC